ncbi:MAG: sulfite exporter TauE/SafE family protein, partial [Anaerolineae bacterium]|nr:sulfite exporter TauE/SafE family protein [Phycisphaerae bacterium]
LGSLLGLGGGLIVIPALTLAFGVDMKYAIGASVVSVIATSSGAAAAYVRERMTNLRVAMLLEVATVSGALSGAFIAAYIHTRWLFVIFGLIMGYSAIAMLRKRKEHLADQAHPDTLARHLRLNSSYFDESLRHEVQYDVARPTLGLILMYIAGIVSGLLGIGSGALKVPAMDLAMRLPIKVSTATSNFMMGVTAAASAGVYFARGDINPYIAAPVAAGVMIGATGGSMLLGKLRSRSVRAIFVIVLVVVSVQMLIKGLRGGA